MAIPLWVFGRFYFILFFNKWTQWTFGFKRQQQKRADSICCWVEKSPSSCVSPLLSHGHHPTLWHHACVGLSHTSDNSLRHHLGILQFNSVLTVSHREGLSPRRRSQWHSPDYLQLLLDLAAHQKFPWLLPLWLVIW